MDLLNKDTLKTAGLSIGGTLALLFTLQSRGIDMMNEKNVESNRVVIEKTIANERRISALEEAVKDINVKIDAGFERIRGQVENSIGILAKDISIRASDRYTKGEHEIYADGIQRQLDEIKEDLKEVVHKTNKQRR